MIYNLPTAKINYHFVNIITNIWQCKMMLWFQEYRDFMQQSARSKTFQNVGSILLMKLSLQVSFGSYLNSLFKTTIVSFILQFLTHNSPEHGCDALNCTLWLMWVMLLWFCSQFCKWIGWVSLVIDDGASWDDWIIYFENVVWWPIEN